jgi:hypothetical protein
MGTLHEQKYIFLLGLVQLLLEWENFQRCRENQNIHLMFNNSFENHAVYEIMWKNVAKPDSPQMAICGACAMHAG